uniref:Uncharacterized protein n=1 Tax=Steinernema glaseri TaxID=37863 RepID=A0A1I8AKY8_9BILA
MPFSKLCIDCMEAKINSKILSCGYIIVHPSSASLHRFHDHPMLTIFEETEKDWVSRRSSVKSNKSKADSPPPPPEITIGERSDDDGEEDSVARAVAYLRRKSLAPEEIPEDVTELREKTV